MTQPHPHAAAGRPDRATAAATGPRVVAWETTRRCVLNCRHCRGAARNREYAGELSTDEGLRLIDAIAAFAKPVLILTGGEPMSRPDIYDLAAQAARSGLRTVMAPCGHLLTPETAPRLVEAGVQCISISLDGATAATHDAFRGVPGAFDIALRGLRCAAAAGLPFQINATVTRHNVDELPALLALAAQLGAVTIDFFFLVPTGRGRALRDMEIDPAQYERTLEWIALQAETAPLAVRTTCAPHYARVVAQRTRGGAAGGESAPGGRRPAAAGCMAGRGFVFVSHVGVLQPCGFLDIACGDLREAEFDFRRLYDESPVFRALRAPDRYGGKCGVCGFRRACGGCRARAYARDGDVLGEEPNCAYTPGPGAPAGGPA